MNDIHWTDWTKLCIGLALIIFSIYNLFWFFDVEHIMSANTQDLLLRMTLWGLACFVGFLAYEALEHFGGEG